VDASHYLDKVKSFIEKRGINCVRAVRVGELLSEIERYAKTEKASLLVMPAFGSSEVHRIMAGSVAEEVVRQSHLPVMIVHPKITFSQAKFAERLSFY
jgi:nucleotide-binding universal stress UspA family protein